MRNRKKGSGFRKAAATVIRLALVMLAVMALSGCSTKETLSSTKKQESEYGKAETMVFLTTERLRYERLYSEQIWSAAVDEQGTAFETVLLSQIHDFLRELKLMSSMAKESGIVLTGKEYDLVKAAAERYLAELGETNASVFELNQAKAEALFSDYWTAEKLVEHLTGSMDLEISDSEAKVITVRQMEFADRETADAAFAKLSAEGTAFSTVAREYCENECPEQQIYRGMMRKTYEEIVFSLENDELSEVFYDDGTYYIVKCINAYDEEATKIRKEEMMRQKKNETFFAAYHGYKDEIELTENKELWNGLSMTGSPLTEADFFQIYQDVCLGQAS